MTFGVNTSFAELTWLEAAQFALLLCVLATTLIWFATFVLENFIALKAPPERRAAWTVGIPYLLITISFAAFAPASTLSWLMPIVAVPPALVGYWFWRREFRRAWIDDDAEFPGVVWLAIDDWKVGLAFVLAAAVLAGALRLLQNLIFS
jgi:hypothetical protein